MSVTLVISNINLYKTLSLQAYRGNPAETGRNEIATSLSLLAMT